MIRLSTCAIVLLTAARVAAQPTPTPEAPTPTPEAPTPTPEAPRGCEVQLVTAPADVRPVIQEWVAAEPRCAVTLAVRVIPVEGGLYVMATDDGGRVYERVVPDGLTAAVLIASWVADDGGTAGGQTPAPTPEAAPTPAPAPEPTAAPMASPSATPARTAAAIGPGGYEREPGTAPTSTTPDAHGRALAIASTLRDSGVGLRIELDWMWIHYWFKLGSVAYGYMTERDTGEYVPDAGLNGKEISVMMQAAFERRLPRHSRFGLRATVGAGATFATGHAMWMDGSTAHEQTVHGVSPIGEATLSSVVWFGRWSVRLGVAMSAQPDVQVGELRWHRGVDARGYAGVARAW